jgi:uncharacterized protein
VTDTEAAAAGAVGSGCTHVPVHAAPWGAALGDSSGPGADAALRPTGVVWVPVQHEDCKLDSPEEADRIEKLYRSLLEQHWVNSKGETARISPQDILVVAPYNSQVRLLSKRLGPQARVGTVDKFQGQEAAVAILSWTNSDADSMPRGPDFLFSKNRLNVAVSRAKCLAIIVASPGLNAMGCSKVEDMPLLNFYSMLISKSR